MLPVAWIHTALTLVALCPEGPAPTAKLPAVELAPALVVGQAEPFATLPITIILMDDVGYELLARAATPNIDALSAAGLNFTRAWVCPACSPTRAAILTGLYPTRTGIGSVLKWGDKSGFSLGLEHTTFAELLNEPVHAFGKWHVSYRHTDPNAQGFDHYAGSLFNLNGTGKGYYDWLQTVDGVTSKQTTYATSATTDFALNSNAGVRFVAYHAAHKPAENPPGGSAASAAGKTIEMVEFLDQDIGRLLLNYYGYVILLADNGTEVAYGGGKGFLTEAGIRVPFIVHGPGVVAGETDALVNGVDIFATLAQMRGIPHNSPDSISFLSVMRGGNGLRHYNYSEAFAPNPVTTDRKWAICDQGYKLTNDSDFASTQAKISLFSMPDEKYIPAKNYTKQDREARARLLANLPF
jgi:arylsulfatase A-like enzyme